MAAALGDDLDINFMVGAEQVDRLCLGRAVIWPQHPIDDFAVSDNLVKELKFTWTDNNYPLPNNYDLYEGDNRIYAGIKSGDVLEADAGTATYYIRSLYEAGHGVNSNEADGEALSGIAPGPITDFEASKNQILAIQFWWTNATGDPTPTYNLYQNGNPLRSNVVSGHRETMPPGSSSFYVKAINAEGETDSNSDTGTALNTPPPVDPPSGSITFTASGTWSVPSGVTSVRYCMIGGGGGGGGALNLLGGNAGDNRSGTISVTPGVNMSVVIGLGGEPGGSSGPGTNGGHSSFGGQTVNGGLYHYHSGDGESRSTCAGTSIDGYRDNNGYGGMGGFGNGGNGNNSGNGHPGGVGAGGGGALGQPSGGAGGRGELRLSWG